MAIRSWRSHSFSFTLLYSLNSSSGQTGLTVVLSGALPDRAEQVLRRDFVLERDPKQAFARFQLVNRI
jgi:hypothetical protein